MDNDALINWHLAQGMPHNVQHPVEGVDPAMFMARLQHWWDVAKHTWDFGVVAYNAYEAFVADFAGQHGGSVLGVENFNVIMGDYLANAR